jgi:hypothetical protein
LIGVVVIGFDREKCDWIEGEVFVEGIFVSFEALKLEAFFGEPESFKITLKVFWRTPGLLG